MNFYLIIEYVSFSQKLYNASKSTDAPPPGIEASTLGMLSYSVDLTNNDTMENKPEKEKLMMEENLHDGTKPDSSV